MAILVMRLGLELWRRVHHLSHTLAHMFIGIRGSRGEELILPDLLPILGENRISIQVLALVWMAKVLVQESKLLLLGVLLLKKCRLTRSTLRRIGASPLLSIPLSKRVLILSSQ